MPLNLLAQEYLNNRISTLSNYLVDLIKTEGTESTLIAETIDKISNLQVALGSGTGTGSGSGSGSSTTTDNEITQTVYIVHNANATAGTSSGDTLVFRQTSNTVTGTVLREEWFNLDVTPSSPLTPAQAGGINISDLSPESYSTTLTFQQLISEEVITVGTDVVSLNPPVNALTAFLRLEHSNQTILRVARSTVSGVDPTETDGIYRFNDEDIQLTTSEEVNNFRLRRLDSIADLRLTVRYYG